MNQMLAILLSAILCFLSGFPGMGKIAAGMEELIDADDTPSIAFETRPVDITEEGNGGAQSTQGGENETSMMSGF